jgi:D-alanyl-lipoteichoic acid acyltransferase DltB (MBOAT superfamily)
MAFVPVYILILGFTIVIDYFAGILIESSTHKKRKFWLVISLMANIGVLAIFKYYNFFIANIEYAFHAMGMAAHLSYLTIMLPIGLSFHTFQAMSYTIEVYRGNQKAERHFGIYSLYVMFYPQLVAGPIERPQNILHQFYEKKEFNYENVTNGLKLMMWGFFKKVVIADRLAIFVNQVYDSPHSYEGIPLLIATVLFSFQIYCDFSGYSDIAIGSARVMGIDLMKNFNRPYFSKSISEFWKRWHISLSSWFKDYLYIPLGGNKTKKSRWYFNLFFTFLISGFWHGASWTFIAWGALHGFYLIFAIISSNYRARFNNTIKITNHPLFFAYLQIIITFCLVSLGWIFFRAVHIKDAFYIITHLFSNMGTHISGILTNHHQERQHLLYLEQSNAEFFIAIASILFMETIHLFQRNNSITEVINSKPIVIRWCVYTLGIIGILLFGVYDHTQFIYFQF